jgi:hypothetical protein
MYTLYIISIKILFQIQIRDRIQHVFEKPCSSRDYFAVVSAGLCTLYCNTPFDFGVYDYLIFERQNYFLKYLNNHWYLLIR